MTDSASPIGTIIALKGQVWAESESGLRPLENGSPVYQGEKIVTGPESNAEIRFLDDTCLSQGADSALSLDHYAYNPADESAANLGFGLLQGAFRHVSGKIAATNPENVQLESPLAVIGIRGTTTVHSVDPESGAETHGVEHISEGHRVIIQDSFGEIRIVNDPLTVIDLSVDAPMGFIRPMTPEELEFFQSFAPGVLELMGESMTPEGLTDLLGGAPGESLAESGSDGEGQAGSDASGAGQEPAGEGAEGGAEASNETDMTEASAQTMAPEGTASGPVAGISTFEVVSYPDQTFGTADSSLFGSPLQLSGSSSGSGGSSGSDLLPPPSTASGGDSTPVGAASTYPQQESLLPPPQEPTGSGITYSDPTHWEYMSSGGFPNFSWLPAGYIAVLGTDGSDNLEASIDPGGTGPFALFGFGGDDYLTASANHMFYGGAGNDIIVGSAGSDTMYGGTGDDTLIGGAGADFMNGGLGADRFRISAPAELIGDTIDGVLEQGTYDRLALVAQSTNQTFNLTVAASIQHIDRIDIVSDVAGTQLVLGSTIAATADANGDGTPGDIRVQFRNGNDLLSAAMNNGIRIDGSALTSSQSLWIEGEGYQDGSDWYAGFAGNDTIIGGAGSDTRLYGGAGNDSISGNGGNDYFSGGLGDDTLIGGTGEDRFIYYNPDELDGDSVVGGDTVGESDRLVIWPGGDNMHFDLHMASLTDIDRIDVYSDRVGTRIDLSQIMAQTSDFNGDGILGDVRVAFRDAYDDSVSKVHGMFIDASNLASNQSLFFDGDGYEQSGSMYAECRGDDTVFGGAGNDTIYGGAGNDAIRLSADGSGNTFIDGGDGNDEIRFVLHGGNNTIHGGAGDDFINGRGPMPNVATGNNSINGGDGNDTIHSGLGNDTLIGGAGDDFIEGYTGRDTMTGGDGADVFFFSEGSGNTSDVIDIITDFTSGIDKIQTGVVGTDSNYLEFDFGGSGGLSDAVNAANAAFGAVPDLKYYYAQNVSGDSYLVIDWDGNHTADQAVMLDDTTSFTHSDIIA